MPPRPQPRWYCRRGDNGESLGQSSGLVSSSECDEGLDEVGSDAQRLAHGPNAAVTAWWAAKLVVPARSVSNLARSAQCAHPREDHGLPSEGGPDADIGQDPRTIGSWITSPACGYAAPRHLGPWYHYYLDRYPAGQISAVDLPGSVPGWPRPMTLTPARGSR